MAIAAFLRCRLEQNYRLPANLPLFGVTLAALKASMRASQREGRRCVVVERGGLPCEWAVATSAVDGPRHRLELTSVRIFMAL
jgi:hypothetical protein